MSDFNDYIEHVVAGIDAALDDREIPPGQWPEGPFKHIPNEDFYWYLQAAATQDKDASDYMMIAVELAARLHQKVGQQGFTHEPVA